jgi:hypothetical protein
VVPRVRPVRRRGALVASVVGVVAAVGLGTYAYSLVGGGGDQPEAHLPAGAVFMAKVDLDPSVSQKVDALRFANALPQGHDLSWDSPGKDPRERIYESLIQGNAGAPTWAEVKGWLGKRAAVAAAPSGEAGRPLVPLLALQVTDATAARASLRRSTSAGTPIGVAGSDGWLLVSDTQAHAEAALADVRTAPLSGAATFSEDMAGLGDQGVAALWVDYGGLGRLLPSASGLDTAPGFGPGALGLLGDQRGHGAVALRFSGPNLELAGSFRALTSGTLAQPSGPVKVELPSGSVIGASSAAMGEQLARTWSQVLQQVSVRSRSDPARLTSQLEQSTGLALPGDLRTLAGTQLSAAVLAPSGGQPVMGLRVSSSATDLPAVVAKVVAFGAKSGVPLVSRDLPGGYVLSTSAQGAQTLTDDVGLTSSSRFQNAVPGWAEATTVVYVDVPAAVAAFGTSMSAEGRKSTDAIDAVGLSATVAQDGSVSFTLRVTTR